MRLSDSVFTQIQDGLIILNNEFSIIALNPCAQELTEYRVEEVKGLSYSSFFKKEEDFHVIVSHLMKYEKWEGGVWKKKKNGKLFYAWLNIQAIKEEATLGQNYLVIIHDLEKLRFTNNMVKLAIKVLENSSEGIMITDALGKIISVNPAFEIVTGYSSDEVIGMNPSILQSGIHDKNFYTAMWIEVAKIGFWKGEIWNKRKNGEIYPEWLTISSIQDELGKLINYVAVFADITDRKYAEEQLSYLAHFDSLTGVANRYSLNKRLEDLIHTSEKYRQQLAVLFLDLDRFKQINDTLGHNYGDLLLKNVSSRLQGIIKNKDTIARLGGDEFVIVLPNLKHPREAIHTAKLIIEALAKPFFLKNQEVYISTSIGISLYPLDGTDMDTLLHNADKAMYEAKASGRNQYELYYDEMNKNEAEQRITENYLRKALERNEFYLVYHPIMEVNSKNIVGVEALIRWEQADLGIVSPEEFIPIAEQSGLIIPISEWVIKKASEDLKTLQIKGYPKLRMNINISALHFNQDSFVKSIESIFENINVNPHYIEFELTESMIMPKAMEAVQKLVKLKQLGIKLSIDDFGTGYSSLSYLNRFPIDTLKIDQSFVRGIVAYKDDRSIVEAIVTMAQRLGLKVVAEGVENGKQFKFLKKENCDFIQGYYLTKPLMLNKLFEFLQDWEQELLC